MFSCAVKVASSSSSSSKPKSFVSHNIADVTALVDRAVDVLWSSRHDSRLWDNLQPESMSMSDDSADVEARSEAVYQRLVYDVTAHAIMSLMSVTSTDTSQPWKPRQVLPSQQLPQSADEAKPLITASVLQHLGLETRRTAPLPRCLGRVRGRRRADQLDEVLAAELVDDESLWTNYSNDELTVKMQVTDMLFDMIVSDTVSTLSDIVARKRRRCH